MSSYNNKENVSLKPFGSYCSDSRLGERKRPQSEGGTQEGVGVKGKLSGVQFSATAPVGSRHVFNMINRENNNTKADLIRKCAFLPVEVRLALSSSPGVPEDKPVFRQDYGVVLFVDISGFTALGRKYRREFSEKLATDNLSRDIVDALEVLTEVCLEYGGDVAKFAGDALLCIWKVNQDNEADLRSALRLARKAAYDMMEKVKGRGNGLDLHGGIGYGSLLHVYLGKQDMRWYLVTGQACVDAVNRLEDSETGVILHPLLDDKKRSKNDDGNSINASDDEEASSSDAENTTDSRDRLGKITRKTNVKDKKLYAQAPPENKIDLAEWADKLSLDDIRSYIPQKVNQKLEGGAVDHGEIHSNICTMFVSLESLTLSQVELDRCDVPDKDLKLLNEAFLTLTKLVRMYNGEVRDLLFDDKGCIFIAVFGAHNAEEMTPLKVVQAGRDISRGFSTSKIGISVGDCFTGMCGTSDRHDFIVMGHDVNMAARYMGNAKPGQIIVSPAIRRATEGYFQYEQSSFTRKLVQIDCFKLVAEKKQSITSMSADPNMLRSTFVGRKTEINAIMEAFNDHRSVLVSGTEGVGKTTLMKYVSGLLGRNRSCEHVFYASGFSLSESKTLHLVKQIVESILNSQPDDEEEDDLENLDLSAARKRRIIRKKDPHLRKLNNLEVPYNGYVLKYLLPNVKTLLNGNSKSITMKRRDPQFRKSEVVKKVNVKVEMTKNEAEMVKTFMRELLGKFGRCVIVVEDIQWADMESFDLISSLVEKGMPNVSFILTTRPQPKQPTVKRARIERINKIMGKRLKSSVKHLELVHFTQAESSELIKKEFQFLQEDQNQQHHVDSEILNVLYGRTHGHPGFLSSLISWVWENKYVKLSDDTYIFESENAKNEAMDHIPDDVAQVMRARLDELPGKAIKLLKIAAAIGKTFSLDLLERLARSDAGRERTDKDSLDNAEVVMSTLETLQDYGFIQYAGEQRTGPGRSITNGNVKPRVQFRIARLFGKDDTWKFSVDIYYQVVKDCIPNQRLKFLQDFRDEIASGRMF